MTFKKIIFTFGIFLMSFAVFPQAGNEIRLYYGISDAALLRNDEIDGGGSYEVNSFHEFGFRFLKEISQNWSLETGINYATAKVKFTGAGPAVAIPYAHQELKSELFSIPLLANYSFWNYFFINGGALVDFQLSENFFKTQSGIGYTLGFGGELKYNNFTFL